MGLSKLLRSTRFLDAHIKPQTELRLFFCFPGLDTITKGELDILSEKLPQVHRPAPRQPQHLPPRTRPAAPAFPHSQPPPRWRESPAAGRAACTAATLARAPPSLTAYRGEVGGEEPSAAAARPERTLREAPEERPPLRGGGKESGDAAARPPADTGRGRAGPPGPGTGETRDFFGKFRRTRRLRGRTLSGSSGPSPCCRPCDELLARAAGHGVQLGVSAGAQQVGHTLMGNASNDGYFSQNHVRSWQKQLCPGAVGLLGAGYTHQHTGQAGPGMSRV